MVRGGKRVVPSMTTPGTSVSHRTAMKCMLWLSTKKQTHRAKYDRKCPSMSTSIFT